MRTLPILEDCSLTRAGLHEQAARAAALRPSTLEVAAAPGTVAVHFADDVDSNLLAEFVEVERRCCSFLEIDLDQAERTLVIASADPARTADVDVFARLFQGSA